MKYRVTNNNQVQLIGSSYQTQVTSLYWLDTMINKAYMGSNLIFEKIVSYYDTEYFTIQSLEDNNTISFNKNGSSSDTKIIYWSSDKTTWNSVSSADSDTTLKTLSNNEKIYIKGSNDYYASSLTVYNYFNSDYEFNISGNIMSLIYGDNFIGQTTLPSVSYIFDSIFSGSRVVDASNLILPATTLTDSCYREMFKGCSSLTSAPVLPATTLASNCYRAMFSGCSNLTSAPELPATTLVNYCYYYMFENCASLTAPPVLPATTLAVSCYMDMFRGCTSLTSAPVLSATTLTDSCYREMFKGCSSLTSAPVLSATTLTDSCYRAMFSGCALTDAPTLPATTLVNYCYGFMFENCTSLTNVQSILPATTLASNCYRAMFSGCSNLTSAPELPATTLVNYCYYRMFESCTSLSYIKCLATNISASNSHNSWVSGVAATGTFVKPSSMTSWTTGTSGIPSGWIVQTASS